MSQFAHSEVDPSFPIEAVLQWHRHDPEQRFGIRGGRFTRVNAFFSALVAAIVTGLLFGGLILAPDDWVPWADILLHRGPTQYATTYLAVWSLVLLFIKWRKLAFQRRALRYPVVPDEPDFVLSPLTVDTVMDHLYRVADEPRNFILYNRILGALSNLRNLGQVGDVDRILRSAAEQDEDALETSYSLVQGFVWAIPVLGFIGTVLGLSQSIGSFSQVLAQGGDMASLTNGLRQVTGGLGTAFDTTLLALVCALVIQLAITVLKKSEYEFLEACSEYCSRHIVGRLRLLFDGISSDSHA
ncbi:MAG: MotA/TolQ/ExbB proton channel family protein [Planctomycetota bacterium]|nr:MAG: MotA/TolQ/ExbB proton channel family protein [Planctomycetota bacterium]